MTERKILQTGLWSTSGNEVAALVRRVDRFNMDHIGEAIKLDIIPYEEGDPEVPQPHYKLRFLFPSKGIQVKFWAA